MAESKNEPFQVIGTPMMNRETMVYMNQKVLEVSHDIPMLPILVPVSMIRVCVHVMQSTSLFMQPDNMPTRL